MGLGILVPVFFGFFFSPHKKLAAICHSDIRGTSLALAFSNKVQHHFNEKSHIDVMEIAKVGLKIPECNADM